MSKVKYKQLNIFGGYDEVGGKNTKEKKFTDYESFVAKFKGKKTTDDCYTPPGVYDAVLEWVKSHTDIEGLRVMRPFYPGGDYKSEDYTDAVVVDNPPFSIMAQILRFYKANKVPFFLFAPTLTLFSTMDKELNYILSAELVVYENGAKVRTSFISNLFGDATVACFPELSKAVKDAVDRYVGGTKKHFPKYVMPRNVWSSATLYSLCDSDTPFIIHDYELEFIKRLDAQSAMGKAIYGGGIIVSDKVGEEAARRREEAARRSAEAREEEARRREITFELSGRERQIIERLNENEAKKTQIN